MLPLTKSQFFGGLRCPKLFWRGLNEPHCIPPRQIFSTLDESTILRAHIKSQTRDLIDLADLSKEERLNASRTFLPTRKPLFGAVFETQQSFVHTEFLFPVREDAWDLVIVRSAMSVKASHKMELAFQRHTLDHSKIKIHDCYVVHIDPGYERLEELEWEKLLIYTNVTREVTELQAAVDVQLSRLLTVSELTTEPVVAIGRQCDRAGECPMKSICWSQLPQDNIFTLTRAGDRAYRWLADGISDIRAIPQHAKLSKLQQIQVDSLRTEKPYIDKQAIQSFLAKLKYPLYFLDFETAAPAIPPFSGTKPYFNIPFQYSLDILAERNGTITHFDFLAAGMTDPRSDLLCHLQSQLGSTGTILAYNAGFEIGVLDGVTTHYNEWRDWFLKLKKRFLDLYAPFRSFHYYHPNQRGSASLKSVLPAMTGQSYFDLVISNGMFASEEYVRTHFYPVSTEEREQTRAALLAYCGLDTSAMVDILMELERISI